MRLSYRKPSKYRAVPTVVDGIRFDSKREAARYQELKLLEKAGEIEALELQPAFELCAPSTTGRVSGAGRTPPRVGVYRGDFRFRDVRTGAWVVEDSKGIETPLSKWKRRHVAAQYGIQVRLV